MQHHYEDTKDAQGHVTQLQRLLQRGSEQSDSARSLGESLVPFLLALVEACWFNGILIGLAGVDFLQTNTALLPFWGPPLLLCAALWLFQRVLRKEASSEEAEGQPENSVRTSSGFGPLFGVLALLDLVLIWLHIYAGANFLLDPRWLLAFVSDVLSLNEHFYQALAVVVITAYFCWRSTRLAQISLEPGHVRRQMWVGLLILLAAILLRAGHGRTSGSLDDLVLVLLIPIFLYLALSAHALARISFIRRAHPFGLEGNVAAQERAVLSIIGGVGLVLLALTLLGGLFSSAFFNSLQPAWQALSTIYGWFVFGLSWLLAWISTPIFWLLTWLASLASHHAAAPLPPVTKGPVAPLRPLAPTSPGIVLATRLLLPVLIFLGMTLLLWFALRRRKRLRITRNRASGDVHVSVWSWALFWRQLKAFWAALFGKRDADSDSAENAEGVEDLPAEPAARTIREIYRALLKKAATIGYVRRRNETPREFQQRLNQLATTSNEPQLGLLTDAYTLTRYGGSAPDEYDLSSARRSWDELAQKWETPL